MDIENLLLEELTDDEDFLELVMMEAFPRAVRQFRTRTNHFLKWNEVEFRDRFRFTKGTVQFLMETIRNELSCLQNVTTSLMPEERLLITLRYLATGSTLQILGDFSGVDKSTASRVITLVLRCLARLRPQYIDLPNAPDGLNKLKQGFFEIDRFPKCIGAIGCTHIKILSPGGDNAEIFRNRKGFFSFNVQAVCSHDLKYLNIVCRWPGSTHNATIFNNSRLKARMEEGHFGDSVLVGDGGYGIKPYLLTPLRNPKTPAEQRYNRSQKRTRNPIERCFRVLKQRFPVLSRGIRLKFEKVEAIVVACCVLHNIAMERGEPDVDAEIEAAIAETDQINLFLQPDVHRFNANNIVRHNLITQYFTE